MNALSINKYFKVDILKPKYLDEGQYYFDFNWQTSEIKYKNGESYFIRTFKLIAYINIGRHKEAVGQFTFFRDKDKNYHFILGDYKVLNKYYTLDQVRYFDLDLPVHPSFISFLKEEYKSNIIKNKKRNKH